ncbi:Alpha/Beta hydrolase protein, partial [Mariannaea sp. PMI_226]
THTIIFLHGRGDSARNFVESLAFSPDVHHCSLTQSFPSVRWVFPEPVATPGGERALQWFKHPESDDLAQDEGRDAGVEDLKKYVASVRNLIHREAFHLGGRYDRIGLMGYCQGAAVAVHALLNLNIGVMPNDAEGNILPRRLAAFLAFSTRMPFSGRPLADTRAVLNLPNDVVSGSPGDAASDSGIIENTPVLLEHCNDNTVVSSEDGRTLRDTLCSFGADVRFRQYVKGGHWLNSPCGIEDAITFLEEALGMQ